MKTINSLFKNLEKEKYEFNRLRARYPDKIPVIVESELLTKQKYLVPLDITVSQLLFVIRKKLKKVHANEALFIFFKTKDTQVLKQSNQTIDKVFNECVPELDGFLYATLQKENTFG